MQLQISVLIAVSMCGFGIIQMVEGQRGPGPMEGWMREMTSLLERYSDCIKMSPGSTVTEFEQLKTKVLTSGQVGEAVFRELLEWFKAAATNFCGTPRTDDCAPELCLKYLKEALERITS